MIPSCRGVSSRRGKIFKLPVKKGVREFPFFDPSAKTDNFFAASLCQVKVCVQMRVH